ncbi:MAG: hypothetical protein NVS3B18_13050 [Candidatus Dormibacteria bacterium]
MTARYRPQPESARLHARPASNYADGAAGNHFVREPGGDAHVGRWWMGTGSPTDLTSPAAEEWWREQVKRVLRIGVEGIKADDGDGFYTPITCGSLTAGRGQRRRGHGCPKSRGITTSM